MTKGYNLQGDLIIINREYHLMDGKMKQWLAEISCMIIFPLNPLFLSPLTETFKY